MPSQICRVMNMLIEEKLRLAQNNLKYALGSLDDLQAGRCERSVW
jgi:hypothetical protein